MRRGVDPDPVFDRAAGSPIPKGRASRKPESVVGRHTWSRLIADNPPVAVDRRNTEKPAQKSNWGIPVADSNPVVGSPIVTVRFRENDNERFPNTGYASLLGA
jgi:hypothetical protein